MSYSLQQQLLPLVGVGYSMLVAALCYAFPESVAGLLFLPLVGLSTCTCNEGACGNSNDTGGNNCFILTSTPFLAVKTRDGVLIENDFMFGKPINAFATKAEGELAYATKSITPDVYKILHQPAVIDGKVTFEIREIEPEESYIDHLALKKVTYPKNAELLVDSSFKKLWVVDKDELCRSAGIEQFTCTASTGRPVPIELTTRLGEKLSTNSFARKQVLMLNTDEYVEFSARVTSDTKSLLLVLGSNYRDWALPTALTSIASPWNVETNGHAGQKKALSFSRGMQAALLFLFLIPVWTIGNAFIQLISFFSSTKKDTTDSFELAKAFGIPITRADVPLKSLKIEYWSGESFNFVELVHPRYYQMSFDTVSIPSEAIQADGSVRLRVTATRRHNLSHVSLCAPSQSLPYRVAEATLVAAKHRRMGVDFKDDLQEKYSGTCLHTVPGDVVDVEFRIPMQEGDLDDNESYLLEASGYYTALSDEGARVAGSGWVDRLSDDSKVWLKEMVSLQTDKVT